MTAPLVEPIFEDYDCWGVVLVGEKAVRDWLASAKDVKRKVFVLLVRYCQCGAALGRYRRQCAECKTKTTTTTPRVWQCIDCGLVVGVGRKYCNLHRDLHQKENMSLAHRRERAKLKTQREGG